MKRLTELPLGACVKRVRGDAYSRMVLHSLMRRGAS